MREIVVGNQLVEELIQYKDSSKQIYIGWTAVAPVQQEAAKKIGWLRRYFHSSSSVGASTNSKDIESDEEKNYLGALGEIVVFNLTKSDKRVRPVSVVSCDSVREADIQISYHSNDYSVEYLNRYDVKSTTLKSPAFNIKHQSHYAKQSPDTLCLIFSEDKMRADLFLIPQVTFELDIAKIYLTKNRYQAFRDFQPDGIRIPVDVSELQ